MDDLGAVGTALDLGQWQLAIELLDNAGSVSQSADGLELRARACYGNGDFEASISAWEDLHTLLVAEANPTGAAMAAATVAMFLMMDTGLMAPVRGWLRRAERLLEGAGEAPAHAIIAVTRGYERFMSGDMEAASRNAALAVELGTRLEVQPAVVIGRVCSARIMILNGHVEAGLDLLDDIALDLMSGAIDPLTTGMMYCELICVAQAMALQDRANEWTDVMDRWRRGAAIGSVSGRCRVHRAELLKISGPCDLAEAEALAACEELRPWMRREFGWPLVELGNIRLRRGDLAGAEEAFMAAHERAWSPFPGLALLRLAQGDIESASTMIADAIAHPLDVPSKERPPFGDLRLAPLFDAQAEIAAAAHDQVTAERAAHQLAAIAAAYSSRSLGAGAALAVARAALLGGEVERAIHDAAAATATWADIGAPFETAKARIVLGQARHQSGDIDGAQLEWSAASAAFRSFGAAQWAERAESLVVASPRAPSSRSAGAASDPVSAAFQLTGDTRTMSYAGTTVLMRDLLGFRYVERLLASPGREFHVLDLVAVERGSIPAGRIVDRDDSLGAGGGAGLPVLDDLARNAYRRRLAEVDDDIDEASRANDIGRLELAERDREYLVAELTHALGLGGRTRLAASTAERARTSVTRSLRYALRRLADHHRALATHLGQHVDTGTYCVYTPEPLAPIIWDL